MNTKVFRIIRDSEQGNALEHLVGLLKLQIATFGLEDLNKKELRELTNELRPLLEKLNI